MKTERELEQMIVEVQAEVEANYEKYMADLKGRRLAHMPAAPHPALPSPGGLQTPPGATPLPSPAGAQPPGGPMGSYGGAP